MTSLIPDFSTVIQLAVALNFTCIAIKVKNNLKTDFDDAFFNKLSSLNEDVEKFIKISNSRIFMLSIELLILKAKLTLNNNASQNKINSSIIFSILMNFLIFRKFTPINNTILLNYMVDYYIKKIDEYSSLKDIDLQPIISRLKESLCPKNIEQLSLFFGLVGITQLFFIAFSARKFALDALINFNSSIITTCIFAWIIYKFKQYKLNHATMMIYWIITTVLSLVISYFINYRNISFIHNNNYINFLIASTPFICYLSFARYICIFLFRQKEKTVLYIESDDKFPTSRKELKEIEYFIKKTNKHLTRISKINPRFGSGD